MGPSLRQLRLDLEAAGRRHLQSHHRCRGEPAVGTPIRTWVYARPERQPLCRQRYRRSRAELSFRCRCGTESAGGDLQDAGYQGKLAEGVRLHRFAVMPVVGITAATAWLKTQPAYTAGEARFAEVAQSRDLGYTWGTYALAAAGNTQAEKGFYVRAWTRAADGSWAVALDVTQPQ